MSHDLTPASPRPAVASPPFAAPPPPLAGPAVPPMIVVSAPIFPRWTGPALPVTRPVLWGALVVSVVGAAAVPWTTPGLGWLVTGLVAVAAVAGAVRSGPRAARTDAVPGPTRSERLARAGWAGAALLLLAAVAVRAAPWLGFLCVATASGCGALAVTGGKTMRGLFLGVLAVPAAAVRALPWAGRGLVRSRPGRSMLRLAATVLVSLTLLVVFAALFAGADPVFATVIDAAMPTVDGGTVGRWVFSVLVLGPGTLGACYLAVARPPVDPDPGRAPARAWRRVEWALPVGTLVLVFAGFVAVQTTVLFGGAQHVLTTEHLTFADYARSGFWQLLTVTVLTLLIMGVAAGKAARTSPADRGWLRGLLGPLTVLSLVVVASAIGRMWTYEQAYGFSRLRILVTACELWLGVVFLLILVAGLRLRTRATWLPRAVAATGVLALLILVALNPDRFVADRNLDRYFQTQRIDLDYLSDLSVDAVPALDRLPAADRACVLLTIEQEAHVYTTDGPRGWTLGRYQADQVFAARQVSPEACAASRR
jgi:hypothetical protein